MNGDETRKAGRPRGASGRRPRNARELAFAVLDEHKRSGKFITHILEQRLANAEISSDDRRLATEIACGVIRRHATLDALIQPCVRRPRHKVEGRLWTLLQLGAHQLVFVDSVPAHAAVHETVDVAKRFGKPGWSGFVNGVMRSIQDNVTDEFTEGPAADAVPISAGRYRRCRNAVFSDPQADEGGYVARAFSFPHWLIQRWRERYDFGELLRLGFWFNTPPLLCLRANRLRVERAAVLAALKQAGIAARKGSLPEAICLSESAHVRELPGFDEGSCTVQDESAMHAARLLAPQPGHDVLDLCAAPGTKTTHLAELMGNRGRVVATDVDERRLKFIEANCRRLGIGIVETRRVRADNSDLPAGPFDRILVDAPCSNTGVLGKRPEARWRLRQGDIRELAALQRRLLSAACRRLKPGGRLVYSTCSIEPEENAQVVHAVLAEHRQLSILEELQHIPGRPSDGGYQALIANRAVEGA